MEVRSGKFGDRSEGWKARMVSVVGLCYRSIERPVNSKLAIVTRYCRDAYNFQTHSVIQEICPG